MSRGSSVDDSGQQEGLGTKRCPSCAEEVNPAAKVCKHCGYDFLRGSKEPISPRANGLAIASLVLGLLWIGGLGSLLAVVFGHISKNQIDQSRGKETGRRMALAGLILGYLGVASTLIIITAPVFDSIDLGLGDSFLTKAEFISQADEICREADEKTQELEPPRTPEALKGFVTEAQVITADLLAQLRELEPPEGDADVVEEMTRRIETAMELLPEIQRAAEARDVAEIDRLATALREEAAEANQIARDYGLKECGRADPAPVP